MGDVANRREKARTWWEISVAIVLMVAGTLVIHKTSFFPVYAVFVVLVCLVLDVGGVLFAGGRRKATVSWPPSGHEVLEIAKRQMAGGSGFRVGCGIVALVLVGLLPFQGGIWLPLSFLLIPLTFMLVSGQWRGRPL
ncbi:hypothetical protein NI17_018015 [Thermobifida halotolerans]|uniref:Uncharacterized protein n=1 Tax=Thermobifida halotolerans TaxID=483545 RepID=A0AA97LV09_9ACTN|nr:hypothetical protein [Thermobifida halotolerans]UOE18678.1 hypothetical protein NI17_018015 [Thermobifida halotolerans]